MNRESYRPGPATLAHIDKQQENWVLVVTKTLHHPREKVWAALTQPEHLKEWAPYDPDRSLDRVGKVMLTTAGPNHVCESEVMAADPPAVLELTWGGGKMRWQLDETGEGTRLTLWHSIPRTYIGMGAAGWHVCLDVMDAYLGEDPIGRIVASDALQFEGWQRLNKEYSEQFGIEPQVW